MVLVLQILENIVMLALLGGGFYVIETARGAINSVYIPVLQGISFGLIAFLVTSTPVAMGDGATLDARAGPVILAGVMAGPVSALIAAALGGFARGLVGGSFAFSGVFVYFVYAAIGTAVWAFWPRKKHGSLGIPVIAAAAVLSCCGAASMFLLISPSDRATAWLQQDLPWIMLANTLSIGFAALVISISLSFLAKSREILEVNDRLRLAKRASGFGVWDFDLETGTLTWDDNSKAMHGLTDEAFRGTFEDWSRNVHPDDLARTQDAFALALKDAEAFDAEYRVIHPNGQYKTIKGDAILLRDAAGKALRIVGTNLDLTDIRATEEQLQMAQVVVVQAQKFESIGQLTGGVAHDFNNLLAVIMGNLELIRDEIKAGAIDVDEIDTLINASLDATRRGADLTGNMLAYARRARLTPVQVDLNEVVRETESWMRRTIPSRIEIETNLQAGLWPTVADQSSLQSALVNLLVNARDAFEGSGKVTIETGNMRIEEDYIADRQEDIAPGRYVMLAVSDNGGGIDPAVLNQIFDPFFTTKQVGDGSGLGLSMVQGFVKQSGGAIRVYSEKGVGTSFKVYFPALSGAKQAPAAFGGADGSDTSPEKTNKRILLVEDRKEVLLVFKKTLEGAGYQVVTAATGDQGYQIFVKHQNFDLIVTDIVMPGDLQGPSMAKKIREIDPNARFVFLSGYATEATVHGNGLHPEDIRLMKPVSRSILLASVEKSLLSTGSVMTLS